MCDLLQMGLRKISPFIPLKKPRHTLTRTNIQTHPSTYPHPHTHSHLLTLTQVQKPLTGGHWKVKTALQKITEKLSVEITFLCSSCSIHNSFFFLICVFFVFVVVGVVVVGVVVVFVVFVFSFVGSSQTKAKATLKQNCCEQLSDGEFRSNLRS